MRPHWERCITHRDQDVDQFIGDYFAQPDRHCLLVGGAGFDPRALHVSQRLHGALGGRLTAFMVREERNNPPPELQARADENEKALKTLISGCTVSRISIFADDGAAVGGVRMVDELRAFSMPSDLTDIVLDMSALSIGVGFPAARFLLEIAERHPDLSFHLLITSNPALDANITAEPDDRVINVRGFAGRLLAGVKPPARIWLPQLAHRRGPALISIRSSLEGVYRTCPMLPFPAADPRRADELIAEYGAQLRGDWEVDEGDLIYVSEANPLDSYRTISALKLRYDEVVEGIYEPEVILSPVGSKVMAVGAMMAAIEHDLQVLYIETVRYDLPDGEAAGHAPDRIVHLWLEGPIYGGLKGDGGTADIGMACDAFGVSAPGFVEPERRRP